MTPKDAAAVIVTDLLSTGANQGEALQILKNGAPIGTWTPQALREHLTALLTNLRVELK